MDNQTHSVRPVAKNMSRETQSQLSGKQLHVYLTKNFVKQVYNSLSPCSVQSDWNICQIHQ
jgi:hypothetical protein